MTKIKQNNSNIRKERRKITAEDFTPDFLVQDILNKLLKYNPKALDTGKTILDPACGNGNMLVEVVKHRLKAGLTPLQAIDTLYGADIMADNIEECQLRIMSIIEEMLGEDDFNNAVSIVCQNIVCIPLKKYKNGSLDYDFEFSKVPNKKYVEKIKKKANNLFFA